MSKFIYSLQNILEIKKKMETQARQEFANAKMLLDNENEKLQELYARKIQYEAKNEALLTGILNFRDIEENKAMLLKIDEYIANQRRNVFAAEKRVEAARNKLAEVMKERKIHESLREKAFEEFLQEENRAEGKTVDELTSYTYGQKRQGDN